MVEIDYLTENLVENGSINSLMTTTTCWWHPSQFFFRKNHLVYVPREHGGSFFVMLNGSIEIYVIHFYAPTFNQFYSNVLIGVLKAGTRKFSKRVSTRKLLVSEIQCRRILCNKRSFFLSYHNNNYAPLRLFDISTLVWCLLWFGPCVMARLEPLLP